MRSSQWFLIAIFFLIMASLFIKIDRTAEGICGVIGMPPDATVVKEVLVKGSEEQKDGESYPGMKENQKPDKNVR